MAALKLPMWFIIEKNPTRESPASDADSGGVYAFSKVERVAKFMASRRATKWDVTHAKDRDGLIMAIADAHLRGETYMRLDPNLDGSGGERIFLTDLLAV
jgi:hypothetical protein